MQRSFNFKTAFAYDMIPEITNQIDISYTASIIL